jgi:hypothetical protein
VTETVRLIRLDASGWHSVLDYYEALLAALGAPRGHGRSVNALIDSMVYGGINAVEPPYRVVISNHADLPNEVRQEIAWTIQDLKSAQGDKEVHVVMELNPNQNWRR